VADKAKVSSLVVIGSSAGGVEALSELVTTIPRDFPAPIILAQHLHPQRESSLDRILGRRSTLPIESITGSHPLQNGVIYLVTPNTNIRITDHEVSRLPDDHERPLPSIDLLFTTAAEVFGEDLIGVILTGTGPDGSAGAREIKSRGGTVIIQNPETAAFPGMPLSLAPTTVDIVANISEIGPLLNDLLRGVYRVETSPENASLRNLLGDLRERSGIDFTSYKKSTIVRRIQRRMAVTNQRTLADYQDYLKENPDEYNVLVTSFLIKVTEFFRDPEVFDYFRDGGLEPILKPARERGELRVWSAGCATGEEAYSLAILITELLGDDLGRMNVRVFGTDLDEDAVSFARRGIYPASAVAKLPHELVDTYFVRRNDNEVEVRKSIRSLVVFGQHDLGQRSPFPRIDLTLCRNVLIYFTAELQRRSLQLFAFALRNGGFLVLGKAETVSPLTEFFTVEQSNLKVYRRVGEHVLIPPTRVRNIPLAQNREPSVSAHPVAPEAHHVRHHGHVERQAAGQGAFARNENILRTLSNGIVVVDRDYRIVMINPAARRHLGIHTVALNEDFIHLVQRVPLSEVRNAIDAALRQKSSERVFEVEVPTSDGEQSEYLQFACHPIVDDRYPGTAEQVLIYTTDVTQSEVHRRSLEGLNIRLQRVTDSHRHLELANENLASVNANLYATNEELLISNEEFQAAAEEVETLNEELQATNEELETLNEELHATIEELNTTNDDLQARSQELDELARMREEQRQQADGHRLQLEALLSSLDEAVALVDHRGEIVRSNEVFLQTFGPSGLRLEFEDGDGGAIPDGDSVLLRASRGEDFSLRLWVSSDGMRREFVAHGIADDEGDQATSGGLLVIREVHEVDD
jgi:two-component system, chemotaxis family, CheB/CheR fusion protein